MSAGTFEARDAVELAVLDRSGFIESRHVGSAVVVSPRGDVVRVVGNPHAPVFPRSCLKPFQALAVLESGVTLDAVQTVLATASHSGTPRHVEAVESILALSGLGSDALQCPADWPGDSRSRDDLVRDSLPRASVYMNCSGKHAAMLPACRANGWPTDSYLDPAHPLQRRIVETVENLTGETIAASGIDGCGAPVHAVSLVGLARGIGRITSAESGPAAQLTASVLANGWAIDGSGRANTVCIDELAVFSKLGAEGVMVMSTTPATPAPPAASAPSSAPTFSDADTSTSTSTTVGAVAGTTVALKMLDGDLRAATLVGLHLLVEAGALSRSAADAVLPSLNLTVSGGSAVVGELRVAPGLVTAA